MEDFNAARHYSEVFGGRSTRNKTMEEFTHCLKTIKVEDLRYTGIFNSWTDRRYLGGYIARKLDRVLENHNRLATFLLLLISSYWNF